MSEEKTFIENAHKTFIEKTQPKNILEIMSIELLKMLLDSYRFPLQTALTVYYTNSTPANIETIDWIELTDQGEEMLLNSPFCYTYRHTPPECEEHCRLCEGKCKGCDTEITLKYYNRKWHGPKLFRCHLGLWEMTYPLIVWGRLVGILYGGQVIVTKTVDDWRIALKEIALEVVWKPAKNMKGDNEIEGGSELEKMDQIGRICKEIDTNKGIQSDKENLKKLLKETMELDEKALKELLGKAAEREPLKKEMPEKRDQIEDICMALGNKGLRSEDVNTLKELLRKTVEREIPQKSKQMDEIRSAIKNAEELTDEKKKKLIDILKKEKKKNVDVNQLLERYDKFKRFGETLKKGIEELSSAKAEAARHEHKLSSSRKLAKAGDSLTEGEEEFWGKLDEIVKETLPDVKGYVLCKSEEREKGFKLGRTCTYDKQWIPDKNKIYLRDFCKQFFKESQKRTKEDGFVLYDLTSEATPAKYHDLLTQAITGWEQIRGRANAVVVPLIEGNQIITGGLVCICISEDEVHPRESNVAENLLKFYVKALRDIVDTLSMVMARNAAVEEQTKLLDAQRKAILCMMHTIQKPLLDIKSGLTYALGRKEEISPLIVNWLTHVKQTTEDAQVIAGATARVFSALVRREEVRIGKVKQIDPVEETRRLAKRMSLIEKGHPTDLFYHNPKRLLINYKNLATSKSGILTDNETFLFTIYNLLDNAIKYSYRARCIGEERYVYVTYEREGNDLCIKIKSYGPVIPIKKGEEDTPFELFWRGEDQLDYAERDAIYRPGLGVGLWVSRELVNAAGGKIWLVPRTWNDPHLTIFAVKFPIAEESKT